MKTLIAQLARSSAARRPVRGALLSGTMLCGADPLAKARRPAPRRAFLTIPAVSALAAASLFAAPAVAQSTFTPANGNGSITITAGTYSGTDQTNSGGGLSLSGSITAVNLDGINISSSGDGLSIVGNSGAAMTVTSGAANSVSALNGDTQFYNNGALDVSLTVGALSGPQANALLVYGTGGQAVSLTTTGGTITGLGGIAAVSTGAGGSASVTSGSAITADQTGIQAQASGVVNVTTTAGGTIDLSGLDAPSDFGIKATGATGAIIVGADIGHTGAPNTGVQAGYSGGTVATNTVTNTAAIKASAYGVYASGALGVTNSGTIAATQNYSVFAANGDLALTNAASGRLTGGSQGAVAGHGATTTINNYGVITGGTFGLGTMTVNLHAGSTTGAIGFTAATSAALTLEGPTGANAAAVMADDGVTVLRPTGDYGQAAVGTISGSYDLTLTGTGAGADSGLIDISTLGSPNTLTKSGTGTWVLTGANTNATIGSTSITAGVLQLNDTAAALGAGDVAISSGATLAFNESSAFVGDGFGNNISGAGGVSYDSASANTLTLTGTNAYSGATTVNSGTLQVAGGAGIGDSSAVTVASGATLQLANANETIGSLAGAGRVDVGGYAFTTGGNNGSTTFSGVIADGGNTGSLTKTGTGTFTLSGTNTYTGATTISAGTLALSGSGDISSSRSVANSATLDISARTSGATIHQLSGAGDVVLGANTLTEYNDATYTSIGGVISGTGGLSKSGGYSLTLTGANTYTGATTINASTLALSGAGSIADSSSVTVASGATFNISGTTSGASVKDLNGAGTITLGAKTLTATYDTAETISGAINGTGGGFIKAGTGELTLSGTNGYTGATEIQGGSVTATTVSALSASSAINLSGASAALNLNLAGSSFSLNNLQSTQSTSQLHLTNAKGLTLHQNAATIFAGALTGTTSSSGITVAGTYSLTLTGVSSTTDTLHVTNTGGGLVLAGTGSLANATIDAQTTFDISTHTGGVSIADLGGTTGGTVILGANTLTLTGAGGEFDGTITGTGGLTIAADGLLTLTSPTGNTYSGATTISSGAALDLGVNAASSLPNSAVTVDGVLDMSNGGDTTIGGLSGAATGQVNLGAFTLTVAGSGAGAFNGVIADGGDNGGAPGSLTISAGTTTLGGVNTYTGLTTINTGATLALSGSGDIGASSHVQADGTFDISGLTNGGTTILDLAGAGAVNLGANTLTVSSSNFGEFDGVISGTGGLTISGGGLGLAGQNTYTGATTVAPGATLGLLYGGSAASSQVDDEGAIDVYQGNATVGGLSGAGSVDLETNTLTIANANGTFSGVISGSGGLTIAGGTQVLTGDNTYTGTTTIAGGNLQLGAGGTSGSVAGPISLNSGVLAIDRSNAVTLAAISGAGALEQAGTGVTTLTGANSYTGATTILAGTLALTGTASIASSSGVADAGVFDISGLTDGGTTIAGLSGTGGVTLGANTLTLANGGLFTGVISGSGGLTVASGHEILTGDNTYTGTTTVNGGNLQLGNGGTTGSVAGPLALTSGVLTIKRSDAVALGAISGGGSLVQAGTGVLTLSAVNSYTGSTTIGAGGTLALTGTASIASSSGVADYGVFDISGLTNGGTTIAGLSGSGQVTLGANTLTLAGGGTFDGLISGSGGLTVAAGNEVLTLNNTYTGTTTISGGNLQLGDGGTSGSVAGPISLASGVLTVNHSNAVTLGAISGAGSLVQAGSGTTTLTGANTYTGSTTVSGGTLALAAGASFASPALALTASGATFDATALSGLTLGDLSGVAGSQVLASGDVTLGSSNATAFAGNLSTTGGLNKVGSGVLTLSGANAFSGPVAVNAGVLAVGGGSAIPDASVVTVASGAGFQVLSNETIANIAGAGAVGVAQGASLTFGGDNAATSFSAFSGQGALVKIGSGVFTVSGNVALTGTTTVSAGKLQLAGSMAGGVTVANGAALTGSGSVGAVTLAAGATLSPGVNDGDFGAITAASLNTAGTIRIDFGGNSTGSKSDKIVVVGAINVTGGKIDAHPVSATNDYTFNQYFALTAGTTFTGQFSNSTDFVPDAYDPRLKERIRYDLGPGAVLEVRFLQDLTAGITGAGAGGAPAGNAGGVAAALNGTENGASDSFSALINALADQTPAQRQASLQQLSGEGSVDGQELALAGFSGFTSVVGAQLAGGADTGGAAATFGMFDAEGGMSSRLGGLHALSRGTMVGLGAGLGLGTGRDRSLRTWAQGFGVSHHLDGQAGFASTETTGAGFAAGVDAGLGSGITVGAAVGYANPDSKTSGRAAKANADSTFGSVYARYARSDWFGGVSVAYGSTSLDLQRTVTVGALTFNPRGSTDAQSVGVNGLLGYRFDLRDGSHLDPMVTVDYSHTHQGGYSEVNGGVAGLRFDSIGLDQVTGTVGARWSKDYGIRGWRVTPEARLAAAFAGGDLGVDAGATFLGAPTGTGSFRSIGAKTPSNWGVLGLGAVFTQPGSRIDFKVAYEGDYASRLTDHHIAATIGYKW